MLILAFDTATPAVTVALHDGVEALASSTAVDARGHGELLAPGIDAVLREAGARPRHITEVAVGAGPGPYTGLRVGLVTARTFGSALGVPVHAVCTLDLLAYASGLAEPFVVATDARRKEVYWARYDALGDRVTDPAVSKPADVEAGDLPAVGEGGLLYPDAFPDARPPTYPSGVHLGQLVAERLAAGQSLLPPEPMYLRRPHAAEPGPRKQVSPA